MTTREQWAKALVEGEMEARANGGGSFLVQSDDPDFEQTVSDILKDHPKAIISIECPPITDEQKARFKAAFDIVSSAHLPDTTGLILMTANVQPS